MLVGDVALVGVPAEFFTGLGMEIKKRSPFKETYIAELANDWIGYLPDREAHQLGGYQTWMGLHSFAEDGTGERMVDEAVAMLEELAGPRSEATGQQARDCGNRQTISYRQATMHRIFSRLATLDRRFDIPGRGADWRCRSRPLPHCASAPRPPTSRPTTRCRSPAASIAAYSQGQEGELRAVATVIEQAGSGKFAIVACDVLFVTARNDRFRAPPKSKNRAASQPAHLLVNATHTHHAPSTVRIHGAQAEPEFVRTVEAGIVQAVEAGQCPAERRLPLLLPFGPGTQHRPEQPAAVGRRHDQLDRLQRADRAADRPVRSRVAGWVFRGPDDKLVSVIYNHSTHTIGSLRPGVRSPSFYGLAAQALEEKWARRSVFWKGPRARPTT